MSSVGRNEVDWWLFEKIEPSEEATEDEFGLPRGIPPPMGQIEISFGASTRAEVARAFLEAIWRWWSYLASISPGEGFLDEATALKGRPPVRLRARAHKAGSIMKAAQNWREPLEVTISFRREDRPDASPLVYQRRNELER